MSISGCAYYSRSCRAVSTFDQSFSWSRTGPSKPSVDSVSSYLRDLRAAVSNKTGQVKVSKPQTWKRLSPNITQTDEASWTPVQTLTGRVVNYKPTDPKFTIGYNYQFEIPDFIFKSSQALCTIHIGFDMNINWGTQGNEQYGVPYGMSIDWFGFDKFYDDKGFKWKDFKGRHILELLITGLARPTKAIPKPYFTIDWQFDVYGPTFGSLTAPFDGRMVVDVTAESPNLELLAPAAYEAEEWDDIESSENDFVVVEETDLP